MIATVWLFVDVLNAHGENLVRIRWMSRAAAALMWLSFVAGGYWYITYYKEDKGIILNGPWPAAHNFFMEAKEHFVITLLLLATYLPIATSDNLAVNREARRLVLCVAALTAVLALMAEAYGAIISMGVKVALMAKPH